LLISKRKFDIRCFVLVTAINGNLCAYWYKDGYIRTSVKEFTVKNVTNKFIHLTNDAIQKKSELYGKFEQGNKLNYVEFQRHFDQNFPEMEIHMENKIVPQMRKIAADTIKATYRHLDKNCRHHTFEVFGYDFMVDDTQTVKLIEVNTNPCLELSSNYLSRIIPAMIDS
jgi:D-alanine-D-alanine ligase-like ATP-grasp enzyme